MESNRARVSPLRCCRSWAWLGFGDFARLTVRRHSASDKDDVPHPKSEQALCAPASRTRLVNGQPGSPRRTRLHRYPPPPSVRRHRWSPQPAEPGDSPGQEGPLPGRGYPTKAAGGPNTTRRSSTVHQDDGSHADIGAQSPSVRQCTSPTALTRARPKPAALPLRAYAERALLAPGHGSHLD